MKFAEVKEVSSYDACSRRLQVHIHVIQKRGTLFLNILVQAVVRRVFVAQEDSNSYQFAMVEFRRIFHYVVLSCRIQGPRMTVHRR